MSAYQDPAAAQAETKQQQEKGPEAFLSFEERKQLKRMLQFPEEFPREFGAWIADYIAVNGLEIPISQVRGFSQFQARSSKITGGSQGTSSSSYVDLATVGPQLEGLSDGTWLFFYGALVEQDYDAQAYMSIQVNDTAAADSDACRVGVDGPADGGTNIRTSMMTVTLKTLDNGGNNTVTAKYKAGVGACNFNNRFLIGLKVGN